MVAGRRAFRWLLVGTLVAAAGCTGEVRLVQRVPRRGSSPRAAAAAPGPCPARPRAARPGPGRPAWRTRSSSATCSTASPPSTRPAVRPAVAAFWTGDPTLRRWEFRLRPDARWSDGSPVRSTDYTYAWQRLADPEAEPAPSPARTPAVGRHRLPGLRRRPRPLHRRPRDPRPGHPGRPPRPPLRRLLPAWSQPIPLLPAARGLARPDPAAYLTHPAGNGPSAWPPRPARAAPRPWSAAPPTRPRRRCSTRSPSTWSPTSRPPGWSSRTAGSPSPPSPPTGSAARTVHGLARRPHHPRPPQRPHPHHLAAHLQPQVEPRPQPHLAPGRVPRHRPRPARRHPGRIGGDHLVPPPTWRWVGRWRWGSDGLPSVRPRPGQGPLPVRQGQGGVAPPSPWPSAWPRRPPRRRRHRRRPHRRRGRPGVTPSPTGETSLTVVRRVAPTRAPTRSSPPPPRPARTPGASSTRPAPPPTTPPAPPSTSRPKPPPGRSPRHPLLTEHQAAVLTPRPQGFNLTPWGALDLATVSLPA